MDIDSLRQALATSRESVDAELRLPTESAQRDADRFSQLVERRSAPKEPATSQEAKKKAASNSSEKTAQSAGSENASSENVETSEPSRVTRRQEDASQGNSQGDTSSDGGQQDSNEGGELLLSPHQLLSEVAKQSRSPVVSASAPSPAKTISQLTSQIADRLLVSEAATGQQEIRIQVKQSVLPGTEVRITQQQGELQVHLVTDQQRSYELLTSQQAALVAQLDERLQRSVVVQVALDSKGQTFDQSHQRSSHDLWDFHRGQQNENTEGDARQRSRGLGNIPETDQEA